jgi:hypothetical protein
MSVSRSVQPQNPFLEEDADRREIWDILMRRDFEAFVAGDWSMVEPVFWEDGFFGIDARKQAEPSQWKLTFPDVATYRDEWLRQVEEFAPVQLVNTSVLQFLFDSCRLEDIEIAGDRAIARKKFNGTAKTDGEREIVLRFQTLYKLVRRNNSWLIAGFVGYLPNPMPVEPSAARSGTPW